MKAGIESSRPEVQDETHLVRRNLKRAKSLAFCTDADVRGNSSRRKEMLCPSAFIRLGSR